MRNLALFSALISCAAGLFLITSWLLQPSMDESLIVPFTGLVLFALMFPLFIGAMAIGRAESLKKRVDELEHKIRVVAAQVPPPGVHTALPGMPTLNELVSRSKHETPVA